MPASASSHNERRRGARRSGTSLLTRLVAGFAVIFLVTSVVTAIASTRITRQHLHAEAAELLDEQAFVVSQRLRNDGLVLRQAVRAAVGADALRHPDDAHGLRRVLRETTEVVRSLERQADVVAIVDLAGGRVLAQAPGRVGLADPGVIDPVSLAWTLDDLQVALETDQGGHVLAQVVRLSGDDLSLPVVVIGSALDIGSARALRADLGADHVEGGRRRAADRVDPGRRRDDAG